MVHLTLSTSKGNNIRYFPYCGHLGLTPVKVEGVVRTRLDADLKPLPAKSITISVRCYEAKLGLLGVVQSNVLVDYTQVLWSNPDAHEEYREIGDLEFPFRISLPAKVAGFSSALYASLYRCTWRVEAIVNHAPITGVGSRTMRYSELPLRRFGLPRSSTPISKAVLNDEVQHPHLPPIRFSLHAPTTPIGPLDLVSIPIHLTSSDPSVAVRSASAIVERRMRFLELAPSPSIPSATNSSTLQSLGSSQATSPLPIPQRKASSSSLSYSPSSYPESTVSTLNASDNRSSSSITVHSIAGTESSGSFHRSESGVWSKTLTLQWPAAKSNSRWSIGESIESELVSIKFVLRVKAVVSSSSGTESLELPEKELVIIATNEAERQLALSQTQEGHQGTRSKSKSPRRSHRIDNDVPPIPATAHTESSHRLTSSSPHGLVCASRPSRRPHTSAGPSDQSRARSFPHEPAALDLFQSPEKLAAVPSSGGELGAAADSGSSASSTSISTSSSYNNPLDDVKVAEWEQELARIEMRSRRSSDLVGFSSKRGSMRPAVI